MQLKTIVSSLALLGLASHAMAQVAEQRVQITGSSIKRIASEGALPVQVISRAEIERQGIASTEQLIMDLNINGNGLDNLAGQADVIDGAARGNNGATSANLRGQGSNATLILLNGRRIAAHGLNGGTVDLNQIPFAAIERIEILKDGASAIYGTDAIGGVINFILRNNVSGVTVNALIDVPQSKGGEIYRASVTGGFGDLDKQGFNFMVSLSVSDNKILRGNQRDFVSAFQPDRGVSPDTRGAPIATLFAINQVHTGLSLNGTTGRGIGPVDFATPGLTVNGINILDLPGQAGCQSVDGMSPYQEALWASPAAKYGCAWDTGRAAVIQQPVKNTNLVSRLTFKLGQHQLIAEAVLGKSESAKSFSPNQISSVGRANATTTTDPTVALPNGTRITNPFYRLTYPNIGASYNEVFNKLAAAFPGLEPNRGQPLAFRWRCMPCGNRELATDSDTARFLVAAEGALPFAKDWEYRTGFSQATSESSSVVGSGYHYQVPFANLINTGVLNPFSLTQTPAAVSALQAVEARGVTLYGGKFTMQQSDFVVSGPMFKMPGGTAMAAVGLDVRTEKYKFDGDQRSNANTVEALIFNVPFDNALATAGTLKRDIKAVYGEVALPIFKRLEVTGAVRVDEYTGFGKSTNPKVAARYTPFDSLLFRGSYSTGFRVPTFKQMFDPVTSSAYTGAGVSDPATCPGRNGVVSTTTPGCASVTPQIRFGGRADLAPETAKMASLGMVFQISAEFSGNLDWWSIDRKGTIRTLALTDMVTNRNYSFLVDKFVRDSAGVLTAVDTVWFNTGASETQGLEFGLRGVFNAAGARWAPSFDVSYLLKKRTQFLPGQDFGASEIGRFTRAGELGIRWKHTASITRSEGNWSATLSQVYRSGYADYVIPGIANGTVQATNWNPIVKPYEVFNFSLGYRGFKNMTIIAGMKNIFNEDPPFSVTYDTNTGAGSSWEPRVADPRGRAFTLRAEYRFF